MQVQRKSLLLALIFLCGFSAYAQTPKSQNVIAFVHASVIPMDKERVIQDQTVVVANGKIVAIGPASKVKVPKDAFRVDASGRYLLPALCDMHVHLVSESWGIMFPPDAQPASKDLPFERLLFPYVANGVTTVQAMSATPQEIVMRDQINRGDLLGPRMILGRMIDGPKKAWPPPLSVWVDSAEEARAAVRQAKVDGYDKMKVYSFLSRESYDAIVATSKEQHMDVIGHIPMALSPEYVIDSGQKMIAHTEEVAKHTHGDYSAERIDYYATLIAKRGVWMTPTLVTTESLLELFDDSNKLLHRPESIYWNHPLQTVIWTFTTEKLYRPIPPEARKKIRDDYEKFQRPLTKALHDKGAKLMTGSDTILPGLVPGFALHRELHELVGVGFTPYEALRTSTTTPFEYLGESDKAGTIEVGKQSDLLLVDANPLQDVSAASKISGVVMRGRWIGKEEIDKKMQAIAASSPQKQ